MEQSGANKAFTPTLHVDTDHRNQSQQMDYDEICHDISATNISLQPTIFRFLPRRRTETDILVPRTLYIADNLPSSSLFLI